MLDQHLRVSLLRQAGDNRALAEEIVEKLSPEAKRRLYHILQGMRLETLHERQKRQRGQFWG